MTDKTIRPWQILVMGVAGLITTQQQQVIEYLMMENKVLKEKLGKKRILLSDNQRRRLAVKWKILGRKVLSEIETIFSPDTILRWHRQLVAKKWDYSVDRHAGQQHHRYFYQRADRSANTEKIYKI